MHRRTITAAAATATAVIATAVAFSSTAAAAPAKKAIPHTLPLWTAHAAHLGAASGSAAVSARIYLAPRGGLAAVRDAASAMSTRGSASYHKFLTPAQYRARFGTTAATVHAVSRYLTAAGLHVTGVGAGNRYLSVKGTVASAEHAFGARIDRYRHAGQCDASGWYGEETLDVEAVHAMAQGATIHYYASASCNDADFLDTLGRVVDDGTAKLVSNSWDDYEANESPDATAAYEQVFLQGATEGISFMFSSGDDGDELAATGTKQVDYPASDPYATGVGGTSTGIGAAGNLAFQTGWGTQKYSLSADGASWTSVGFLYGAGGGSSALFGRPAYQDGVTSDPHRQVPDVAMDADPNTGMLIGETQKFPKGSVSYDEYRIGGTSLASPLFAGMTALTLQHSGGTGAGLLNELIYAHAGAFTDVAGSAPDAGNVRVDFANGVDDLGGVLYSVRTFNQDSSLAVGPGYDQVTGIGVPNTGWLAANG
jgi:subtilase family serine protease